MTLFDGLFSGELDALETMIQAAHTDWKILQGEKALGETLEYDCPVLYILLRGYDRDPSAPDIGWVIRVSLVYFKYDVSGEMYDALDDAEALADLVNDWYIATRNKGSHGVFGHFEGGQPVRIPRGNSYIYGHELKIKINKLETN